MAARYGAERPEPVDVVVAGGGLAGLAAAAGFGAAGYSVLCVDPVAPVADGADPDADLRTTAILQPGQALLDRIGLWPRLAPHASPLRVMRIVDAGGPENRVRLTRDFVSGELGAQPFGWNLPNWLIRREALAHLDSLPGVRFEAGRAVTGVVARSSEALVRLDDGHTLRARLLVAADGRRSAVREALGIGVRERHYDQSALAFAVTHQVPHENVSTEIHRSGGPFTLVPLPDRDGQPCSAVVWMERRAEAARLMALEPEAFSAEASARSCGLFGPLSLAGRRSLWPMLAQVAQRFARPHVALIAEAAHVVPPIGAQGLNMSLADLALLLDLAGGDPARLGDVEMLAHYDRARRPEATARVFGVDLLNRFSMVEAQPLRDLRQAGLRALHGVAPVRHAMMRAGLGAGSERS